jgi:leucyl aminopeptidase
MAGDGWFDEGEDREQEDVEMLEVEGAAQAPNETVAVGVPVVCAAGTGNAAANGSGADGHTAVELLGGLDRLTGRLGEVARALLPADVDQAWIRRQGFKAKAGQSLVLRGAGGAPSVVLVGMGDRETIDAERWRLAAAALVRASGEGGGTACLLVPEDLAGGDGTTIGQSIAEGAVLAAYRFDAYRSSPPPSGIDRLVAVSGDGGLATGIARGRAGAAAVVFARDLVNTPPSDLPPRRLAELARERMSGLSGTEIEVWDEDRIKAERLGGLQAVSRGSAEPPRLVRATYTPPGGGAVPHVVLVGKGITFDSGGLSLKPADAMVDMKTDMTGAAVVLGAVSACAELGVPVKVTAIAPITENMPGGRATKPGDVFTARNGKTVEVLNTDAEGRLVLADGLSLAVELEPDAIVDVATLTGAAIIALGEGMGAVFGSDEPLVEAVRAAGGRAGERLWPLPMPDDYAEHIESEIADMKNMGRARQAGSIAAAMLLANFVGDVPWAHLDIAGTARATESSGYTVKGGTAFGVRTLLDLLEHFEPGRGNGKG